MNGSILSSFKSVDCFPATAKMSGADPCPSTNHATARKRRVLLSFSGLRPNPEFGRSKEP